MMKTKRLLLMTLALVACMMCSMSAVALEAYAEYTTSNTTLTFYYDNLRSSRTGTTYDLNEGDYFPDWYDDINQSVTRAVFDPSFAGATPTSTLSWFGEMSNLQSITGLNYLNTSNVTDMYAMFEGCSSLSELDLSNFNTSRVENMCGMFAGCSALTTLDLRSFNTGAVTYMDYMFASCSNLTTIYVGNGWSTEALTSYEYHMFEGCFSLVGSMGTIYSDYCTDKSYAHVDGGPDNPGYLSIVREAYVLYKSLNKTLTFYFDDQRDSHSGTIYELNTGENEPGWYADGTCSSVRRVVFDPSFAYILPTSTYAWFAEMSNLQSITGLQYLKTSEVTNMMGMFAGCSQLTTLDLSSFNTAKVRDMGYMFGECSNLTTITVSRSWSTAAVTSSLDMFLDCTKLVGGMGTTYNASQTDKTYARIDGGPSSPGYLTAKGSGTYVEYTHENNTLTFYNDNARESRTGTIYDLNTGNNYANWYENGNAILVKNVVFDPSFADARPTSTATWFTSMENLESITGLNYLNTSEVTNMWGMFALMGMTTLDLSGFNTAKVTNMNQMFFYSGYLTKISVGSGWTTDAVTNSENMFAGCISLVGGMGTTYDENHVDKTYAHIDGGTANPGYLSEKEKEPYVVFSPDNTTLTFYFDNERFSHLDETYDLNESGFYPAWVWNGNYELVTHVVFDPSFADARPVTTDAWFYYMTNLQSISGMEYLNTSEVTTMWGMFAYCSGLTSLDLSSFNTANVTEMEGMFYGCSNLTTITVSAAWNTDAVTYSADMFQDCASLVGDKGTTYNESHVDKTYAHIDGGTANPGYLTAAMEAYAEYTNGDKTLTFYYDKLRSSRQGTVYDMNKGNEAPGWQNMSALNGITKVVFDPSFANYRPTTTHNWFYRKSSLTSIEGMSYLNTENVTDMEGMFFMCRKLKNIDVSHFNTGNVTTMCNMFYMCDSVRTLDLSHFNTAKVTTMEGMFSWSPKLTSLDLSSFNTGNVTTMYNMFYSCTGLTSLNLSSFNTQKVTSMVSMFRDCTSLTSLNLSSFNTSNVTSMDRMFYNCPGLTRLDLRNFNTQNVTSMANMFRQCTSLTSLDLSGFNTAKVINMSYMFDGSTGLTSLDLSNFNTEKVTNTTNMFYNCTNLTTIYSCSDWNTDAVTNSTNMFRNCTSLVGGMGTAYNISHTDKTYARIDGGTDKPGYFTEKPAYTLGDVNGDGFVNVSDVTALISIVLGGHVNASDCPAGDMNGDGNLNVTDVTALISRVLKGN